LNPIQEAVCAERADQGVRLMKRTQLLLAAGIFCAALAGPAAAQRSAPPATPRNEEAPALRVAAVLMPPFIVQENGSLSGFNIELWNAITDRLKRRTAYQLEPDVVALEGVMRSRRADITVAPVIVTSARDEEFDFTLPLLSAGLQTMVRETHQKAQTENPLWDLLRLIVSRTTAIWLGMGVLLALIPAHVIWLLERRHEDGMISSRNYFPGIFEALYWGMSVLTAQAMNMPSRWLARAVSVYWMFVGVVFVAFYTAQLTTTLTVQQIRGAIEGPEDLPGKPVATLTHSLGADYLRAHHAQVREFPTTEQLFKALLDKQVDAVMISTPVLRYYAAHEGKGQVRLVGPEINVAPVAIMVQLDSPLRKKIDIALLALGEDGTYQRLYEKWFGTE
jgi:polar amino acid transport system substrate-binding protein